MNCPHCRHRLAEPAAHLQAATVLFGICPRCGRIWHDTGASAPQGLLRGLFSDLPAMLPGAMPAAENLREVG